MTTSMAGSLDCYCLHEILTPDMSAKGTAAAWSSSKNWDGGSYICNSGYAIHVTLRRTILKVLNQYHNTKIRAESLHRATKVYSPTA